MSHPSLGFIFNTLLITDTGALVVRYSGGKFLDTLGNAHDPKYVQMEKLFFF